MKILSFDEYRDGGTIGIRTDKGVFCLDGRGGVQEKGRLFHGYPKKDGSNLVENSAQVIAELLGATLQFKGTLPNGLVGMLLDSQDKAKVFWENEAKVTKEALSSTSIDDEFVFRKLVMEMLSKIPMEELHRIFLLTKQDPCTMESKAKMYDSQYNPHEKELLWRLHEEECVLYEAKLIIK